MEPIVGIDLGTTNSEVAFIIDGNADVLKIKDDGIVPSCVGIDNDEKIIVGTEARNQAAIAPGRTVLSVKRLMGTDEKLSMGDATYLPQEISAFILKALKDRAETVLEKPVSKAVITVPAYFTDAQRQATREAGQIAGLEVARIINEPTAAALAYESTRSETQRILIFDLGGGTFDVSIVKIENGVVEVLSSTGDNHLGGDDFDQDIVELLVDHIQNELNLSVTDQPMIMARLKRAAEDAKITLSSEPYAKIEEDHIGKKAWKDIHLSYELSRLDFEEMIEEDLERTMVSVNQALKDAALLPSAIDKIILVGGSTRIPRISEMLEEKFGRLPHSEIDPDLCVALGAAIQAGREMGFDSTSVLLDITPYTFGTSAIGELDGAPCMTRFVPLIRRNTKLPTAKTEAFYTLYDGQEAVEIKVYQGEEPNALDDIEIGKYKFKLTPKSQEGSVILLNYDLDLNGILKIEAIEKASGRNINAVIENAFAQFTDEEMAESKKRIDEMWGETTGPEDAAGAEEKTDEGELPPELAGIMRKAESQLESASEEDRDEMINLMEDMRDAVKEGRLDDAAEFGKELEEILFYLG
ncbi:Hsp70 family protein [Desulfonema magnum]|uniref:Chaperone protein, DnaK-like n=1 Tax=Desulfonema magnum TaxID=45655 RepID=A0A975BHV4_9BACT|nr:Hsp70 family protein [Desulfonema magnum]QTA86014.1 Putative chaperone protein, DnaK-like [Desulfonema magnum]